MFEWKNIVRLRIPTVSISGMGVILQVGNFLKGEVFIGKKEKGYVPSLPVINQHRVNSPQGTKKVKIKTN